MMRNGALGFDAYQTCPGSVRRDLLFVVHNPVPISDS
jgi:hypothetical protein